MTSLTDSVALAADAERARRCLRPLLTALAVWFVAYLVVQGPDGYFAITADRIDSAWVAFTVLNIPLHLALTAVAGALALVPHGRGLRAACLVAATALTLAAAHVVLSVATA